MARRVRLVASDLDGTLLDRTGAVSKRTTAALDRLRAEHSVDLVAVTGRPPRWVPHLALGPGLAICSNGALVIELPSGRVVRERLLTSEAAGEIVVRLRREFPEAIFALEYPDGAGYERGWPTAEEGDRGARVLFGPADELVAHAAAKILALVPHTSGDELILRALDAVGDEGVVTASGNQILVEVSAPGVDKASTLALVCDERGIDAADVVAFGDARNDIALLTWAGWGVAMADAHPLVIESADEVTASTDHDGVAQWLEGLLG